MVLPSTYSRRKRLRDSDRLDIYQYDEIPMKLRVQLLHMFDRWNQEYSYREREALYRPVCGVLRVELGVKALTTRCHRSNYEEFHEWFSTHNDVDELLDAVEFCVQRAESCQEELSFIYNNVEGDIEELNARMLDAGFGYQINGGDVLRVESTLIHKEVVVPALSLLSDPSLASANEEFRQAYQEFNLGSGPIDWQRAM